MSIFLWVIQVLLALHTAVGAVWKLSNPAQRIPSLIKIPQWLWLALIPFEIVCAVGLVIPLVMPTLGNLVPLAAIGIGVEMLLFSVLHLQSTETKNGPMFYWFGVVVVCAVVIVGRIAVSPL